MEKSQNNNSNHEGAVAMQLAQELYPDEYHIWEEIKALRDSFPHELKVLQADDVEQLSTLAEKVEDGKRRGAALRVVVQKLVRAPEHKLEIHRGHATTFLEQYQRALIEDVQTRVCELRQRLAELRPDKKGRVLTVTRSPYTICRVPCALGEKEAQAITWLYMLIDRRAWRTQLRQIETKAFRVAQERFRLALATGVILADDHTIISNDGVPRAFLARPVRDKLGWVGDVSLMLEEVFESFYRPATNVPDHDRFHIFALWARPYAADVVNFLNSARCEVIAVMNELFESAGLEPYDLVAGHKFPAGYILDGQVSDEPVRMTPDELCAAHEELRRIGVDHLDRPA